MSSLHRPYRLYFLSYPSTSHMAPLFDLAGFFAARGLHVTFFTTPANAHRFHNSIAKHIASGHHISLQIFDFPSKEVGLPDGVENLVDGATDIPTFTNFCAAANLLEQRFQDFILQNPPDCIVADFMFPWASDLATRLGIPAIAFNTFCLFTVCVMLKAPSLLASSTDTDPVVVPGLPHPITMNLRPPKAFTEIMESRLEAMSKTHGVILNNFAELDGEYVEHYEKRAGHKAWHLGPGALIHTTAEEKTDGSNKGLTGEHECLSWLNSKPLNSVLYICFGSTLTFSDTQLYEIACAIESSGHHFIWVVFKDKTEKEKWLPEGFEKRMKDENKGMIIRGWAPQLLILGHPAVGGFLTHCGWNSVVESICAGVPMITWPVNGDQFYNEMLIIQVHGIAVELGVEEWCEWLFDEWNKKLVRRDRIEKAVRRLMDGGEEVSEMRRRAGELGKKAKEAVKEGGSSHNNLTALIEDLKRLRDRSCMSKTGSENGVDGGTF